MYSGACTACSPEDDDVVSGAVWQAVGQSAAYDALSGVRGDPLLDEGTQVFQGLADVVDEDVISLL